MDFAGDIETPEQFWGVFNARASDFRSRLASDSLDDAKAQYTTLQDLTANAAHFLPQYDVRRSQEVSNCYFSE